MNIFQRAVASLQARRQNVMVSGYRSGEFCRDMQQFGGRHNGSCFVLGNGPSLTGADLDRMAQSGAVTFATNRVYKIFDQTAWRPTYYVCEDYTILRDIQPQVEAIETKDKFFPITLKAYDGVDIAGAHYFNLDYQKREDGQNHFSSDGAACLYWTGTVTVTCIQLAAYMGFTDIYLAGVDHNFQKIIGENGQTVIDQTAKDYFCENYDTDIKNEVVHDLRNTTQAYRDTRTFCDAHGIRVYNATRGGKLEVFERADLDSLLNGGAHHG